MSAAFFRFSIPLYSNVLKTKLHKATEEPRSHPTLAPEGGGIRLRDVTSNYRSVAQNRVGSEPHWDGLHLPKFHAERFATFLQINC
jgi:hypothetical protein